MIDTKVPIPREELHLASLQGENILFHPPSFTFYRVNSITANLLEDYINGESIEDLAGKYEANQEEIIEVFRLIRNQVEISMSEGKAKREETWKKRRDFLKEMTGKEDPLILRRLTLNISNDCNLRCRYCYADTGAYGGPRGLMNAKTAIKAVDAAYGYFDGIDTIQFFGGEPALNVPVMRAVCEHVNSLHSEKKIKYPAGCAMVTNGTIMTDDLIDTIKSYKIGLTVSLDGPEIINDEIRVYSDGKGSFSRVVRFIKTIQKDTESYLGIEGTYTARHIEKGISLVDLMDFFSEELGITSTHIPPVGAPTDQTLELHPNYSEEVNRMYADAVSYTIWSATTESWKSLSLAERQIRVLVTKEYPRYICPASGTATISVASNGDIYPCFMFIGKDKFRMGNIFDDGFSGYGFRRIDDLFGSNAKDRREDCRVCWARVLCSGCLGMVYDTTGSIFDVPRSHCELVRAMAERTLVELAKVRGDPGRWERLVENMTRGAKQEVDAPSTVTSR